MKSKHDPEFIPLATRAELRAERDRLRESNVELLAALEAIGCLPDGFCCCPEKRHGDGPESSHVGECRDARSAIAKAKAVTS